jgi:acyl-CoA thioesterase-1
MSLSDRAVTKWVFAIGLHMILAVKTFAVTALLIGGLLTEVKPAGAQIVAIGASNVAGRGVSTSEAWPAQLEGMLAGKGRHVHVTNAGINGDTNAGMLARLGSSVPDGTKIVVLDKVGGGWNARRRGQGDQKAELAAIESQLRTRSIKVIPMWWNPALRGYLQPDGIHFTPEGHRLVASKMLSPLMSAMK